MDFWLNFFFHIFTVSDNIFISFCNILWNLSVEVGNSSKKCRKTWYFLISANKSKTDETISKNSILEEKNSGQKFITLANSGGHNLVKMIFCLFSVAMGQKFLQYAWKIDSNRSSSRESQKKATMGRYLGKSSTDFF